jgi:hypothetical protein
MTTGVRLPGPETVSLQRCVQQILTRRGPTAKQHSDLQQRPTSRGEELLEPGYPLVCHHPHPPVCRDLYQSTNGRLERLMANLVTSSGQDRPVCLKRRPRRCGLAG